MQGISLGGDSRKHQEEMGVRGGGERTGKGRSRKGVLAGKLPLQVMGAESCRAVLGASADHAAQRLSASVEGLVGGYANSLTARPRKSCGCCQLEAGAARLGMVGAKGCKWATARRCYSKYLLSESMNEWTLVECLLNTRCFRAVC